MNLSNNIEMLKGVAEKRVKAYEKLHITTIGDLLTFYPRTYIDFTTPIPIQEAVVGENNVIKATVINKQGGGMTRNGLMIFKVSISDSTGTIVITIFNSKYMFDSLYVNKEYIFYGKVTGNDLVKEMSTPMFLTGEERDLVRPIYHLTNGLSNNMVINNMKDAFVMWGDCLHDHLPDYIKQENELSHYRFALDNIHFPKNIHALELSQKRLIFDELLTLQLGISLLSSKQRVTTKVVLKDDNIDDLINSIPFELTDDQMKAINESINDMKCKGSDSINPMNRLLQGDVGSGKTIVSIALAYIMAKNGYQAVIMAPTQILAEQHFANFKELLEPLGFNIGLLTSGLTKKNKTILLKDIEEGKVQIVVGTHAIISSDVKFNNLGIVVTDEQHRFGVEQRDKIAKKGNNPHILVMSATPIPRTLALLIYGDLDISIIKQMPKGRQPIETLVISSKKRERAFGFLENQIEEGRQCYIVCPIIDENKSELVSINAYVKALQDTCLAKYEIGLMHGKLKNKVKDELMSDFKSNKINILVSTTVVEVGVDVPNSTIMMIENAERFGLSQLHQLRGRVGRGQYKSFCILVSDHKGEENKKRLSIMKKTSDGFEIAEEDLKIRGPGDFFGFRQHGLPNLRLADLYKDIEVLNEVKEIAKNILANDPDLSKNDHKGLRHMVDKLFEDNVTS